MLKSLKLASLTLLFTVSPLISSNWGAAPLSIPAAEAQILPQPPRGPNPGGRDRGGGAQLLPPPPSGPNPGGRPRGGGSNWRPVSRDVYPIGGFSRSAAVCPTTQRALVPSLASKHNRATAQGVTLGQPTFWFDSVPTGQATQAPTGTFILQNLEGTEELYSARFTLPTTASVVGISLPKTVTLKPNQIYRWFFVASCGDDDPGGPVLSGLVEPIAPDAALKQQLATAKTPQQRFKVYVQNGIWFDALNELAGLRLQKPTDRQLQSNWTNLLNSANLPNVSQPLTLLEPMGEESR